MLFSSAVHAALPPLGGTSIGTQASATYSVASGHEVKVLSNPVQTFIKKVYGLSLEGSQYAEGKQELLTSVVNTGNTKITRLELKLVSLIDGKTYKVDGKPVSVGKSFAFSASTIEAGAMFSFKSVIDAEKDAKATIKVIGYDADNAEVAHADLEQTSRFTNDLAFHVTPQTSSINLLRKDEKEVTFDLGLTARDALKQKRTMAFEIALNDKDAKGLEFLPTDYELTIQDGGGSKVTSFKLNDVKPWSESGETLNAKLMLVNNTSLRLVIELNEVGNRRAMLNFKVAAKSDAAFGVNRFNARYGEAVWDSGAFVNQSRVSLSAPVQATVINPDAALRAVTMTHQADALTTITAVAGQIINFRALVKNTGGLPDTMILGQTTDAAFPAGTIFTWDDSRVTTSLTGQHELALDSQEELLVTFSIKLPPSAPTPPTALRADVPDVNLKVSLHAQPKGTEKVEQKTLEYKVVLGKRSVALSSEGDKLDHLVEPDNEATILKLTLKNNTTTTSATSHDLYTLEAKSEKGLVLNVYAIDGAQCGVVPDVASAILEGTKLPAGGSTDICVAVVGKNGGLGDLNSSAFTVTATPKLVSATPAVLTLNLYAGKIDTKPGELEKKIARGSSISYVYEIENTGDATLTILKADVVPENNQGWPTKIALFEGATDTKADIDTLVMQPKAKGRIQLTVTVPVTTNPGAYAETIMSAKGTYAHSSTLRTLFSGLKYTTHVQTEGGALVKQQALDLECSKTLPSTYGQAAIDATPDQCVWYQVQFTNTGTAAIDKVTIVDSVSTHAKLVDGTQTLKSEGKSVGEISVANRVINAVFNSAEIKPNGTLTLEYQIKIKK
ncbi:hypothetical protein [Glaciimonas sp. GG7]